MPLSPTPPTPPQPKHIPQIHTGLITHLSNTPPTPNRNTPHTPHHHLTLHTTHLPHACHQQRTHPYCVYHPHTSHRHHSPSPGPIAAVTANSEPTPITKPNAHPLHTQHRVSTYTKRLDDDQKHKPPTTHSHRPCSKAEKNLTIPQVNINGIKQKLDELKLPSSPPKPKYL